MRRILPKVFYDRRITGPVRYDARAHRGVQPGRFYVRGDPMAGRPSFLIRAALDPWMFALTLFGFGFVAVFVNQATFLVQVVMGAPIFEELVKLGLALLLAHALTFVLGGLRMRGWEHPGWLAVRLPLALAVGAGFGVLEHNTPSYSSEDMAAYVWRVLFHSVTTGLSMVVLQAALRSGDVRTRWLAALPSMFIHYLNNYAALVLGIGSVGWSVLGLVAEVWSQSLVVALGVLFIAAIALPGQARRALDQVANRLSFEEWVGAAAPGRSAPSSHRRPARGR